MSEIQRITERHRAMMRDMVLLGFTNRDAAAKYRMSEPHISVIINSPLWKKEAAIMRDNAVGEYQGRVMTMVPSALKAVEEIMNRTREIMVPVPNSKEGEMEIAHVSNPPASRLRASEMLLKMSGMIGDSEVGGGKSIVLNLVQPAWDTNDGKPGTINIQVNQ